MAWSRALFQSTAGLMTGCNDCSGQIAYNVTLFQSTAGLMTGCNTRTTTSIRSIFD